MLRQILSRPISVSIATVAMVALGLVSLWRLPISLLPSLERPELWITYEDGERGREELLQGWIQPAERRLQTVEDVVEVISEIGDGQAIVRLQTEWQTDIDRLRLEVERRLSNIGPSDLEDRRIEIGSGDTRPVLQIAVLDGAGGPARTAFAERVLVPEMGRLKGAGRIEVVGGADLRPTVRPRPADLFATRLTVAEIAQTLSGLGRSRPLGRVRDGASLRPIHLRTEIEGIESLRRHPVGEHGQVPLSAVANVGLEEVPTGGLFRWNGKEAVLVELYRAPGANAVRLAVEGKRRLQELAGRARSSELRLVRDGSREVVAALARLGWAALGGLLLGTLVLRLALGSWRPTLALAVVVPVSILSAMTVFYAFGVALDVVSLAGLALAAGMLVDNSIVVMESIGAARERRGGVEPPDEPVYEGTVQIAGALGASFLTTAVVFLPLIFLRGIARAFFGVQAFAIVVTLLISLALSLSLTPVLSRRLGVGQAERAPGRSAGRDIYLRYLEAWLPRKYLALALITLALGGTTIAISTLPKQLLPPGVTEELGVELHFPTGMTLFRVQSQLAEIESLILGRIEATSTISIHRGEERVPSRRGEATTTIQVRLDVPENLGTSIQVIEEALAEVPGFESRVKRLESGLSSVVEGGAPVALLEASALTPTRARRLELRLVEHLEASGIRLSRLDTRDRAFRLSSEALASKASTLHGGSQPLRRLNWDSVRLATLGVDPAFLERQLRPALGGFSSGWAENGGEEAEIWFPPAESALALVPIRVAGTEGESRMVPLSALADLEEDLSPPSWERRNGRPMIRLLASAAGPSSSAREIRSGHGLGEERVGKLRPLSGRRVEAALKTLPLAPDETIRLGGAEREIRRSFTQLYLVLGLALLLVYLTIAALYESLTLPWVVIVTVPVAAAGAFWALAATGQAIDVMSVLGIVLLVGIVVNNAIVLVHRAEQHRGFGEPAARAIRVAAAERYRPILMTTATTFLGMLPLALAGGEGAELRRALATVVSGGLLTSWMATLWLVPVLYLAALGRREES